MAMYLIHFPTWVQKWFGLLAFSCSFHREPLLLGAYQIARHCGLSQFICIYTIQFDRAHIVDYPDSIHAYIYTCGLMPKFWTI